VGVDSAIARTLSRGLAILLVSVLAALATVATRRLTMKGLTRLLSPGEVKWTEILPGRKALNWLSHLAAALVIYWIAKVALAEQLPWSEPVMDALFLYMIVVGMLMGDAVLNGVVALGQNLRVPREMPIRGFVQLLKILVHLTGLILAIAVVLNKSPVYVLSGLGVAMALLVLLFKDTILGFVAGIQLAANRMVAQGDWITVPQHGADGDVLEITLTAVKVQNFDKTIVTIPTYALISESFQNWRGMREAGGRRIKRAVYIDMDTIRFCTEEMLQRFADIRYLSDYLRGKREEIGAWNAARQVDQTSPVNERRLTNIGTFRAYLVSYLKHHPLIRQDMLLLVRPLAPTEHGLPIEVYAFCAETAWPDYEAAQAAIFDHILAVVPEFDLRAFQAPAGSDMRHLAERPEPPSPNLNLDCGDHPYCAGV
jgi:miniconductance mechanosensitive channel